MRFRHRNTEDAVCNIFLFIISLMIYDLLIVQYDFDHREVKELF